MAALVNEHPVTRILGGPFGAPLPDGEQDWEQLGARLGEVILEARRPLGVLASLDYALGLESAQAVGQDVTATRR